MKLKLALGVVLVLGIAIFLRTYNLKALPVFADESIYVRWAQVMKAESTLRFLPLSDGKQPLFMWAMIPMFKFIADPLIAGRLLSATVDVVTVVGVGLLGWLIFRERKLGVLAGIIWAVIPYSVFFARMALVDSMLAGFVVWGVVFALLAIRHQRFDWAMLAGFSWGFAWLTKSPALIGLLLLPSLVFLELPKKAVGKYLLRSIVLLAVTVAIAFGMYNILRLGPEFHMIALRNKDYVHPFSEIARHPLDPLKPHLIDAFQFYFYLLTPVGLLLAVWGLITGGKQHLKQKLVLLAWCLLPIIAQGAMAKTFTARYLLYTVPFAVVLAAHAIWHIGQHTQKHLLTYAVLGLVIISGVYVNWQLLTNPARAPLPRNERAGYLEEWTAGQGIRESAELIKQASLAGPVLVGSEGFFGTPFDGLQLYLNGIPNVRVIGVGVWIDSVHEKLISALPDNQVFLVVNSTRFHADPAALGINLLASYPKAIRPDGSQEHLLLFEVPKSLKK